MPDTKNLPSPIRIIVDTTRRCNLSCWFCHSASGPFYKGPELSDRDISEILEVAEENKVFDVTLTGGEPILWAGLEGAMKATHHLIYTSVQLITNATVLSQKKIGILKHGNLKRICVSLDGLKEAHEKNRGKGTFERTLRGISQLREVVDNLTVISVIDATNYSKWPQLTKLLVNLGVKQHHLAPVCFAGGAMYGYRGLTEQHFIEIRKMVEDLKPKLSPHFMLRFNDVLVNGPEGRIMPLQTFTELVKGWHVVVRPNGDVSAFVRAWGRSWRQNEILGNIHRESIKSLINKYRAKRNELLGSAFDKNEEVKRKFHIKDVTEREILNDVRDVVKTEKKEKSIHLSKGIGENGDEIEKLLSIDDSTAIKEATEIAKIDPRKWRVREEENFGFVFDTETFDVTILNKVELGLFKETINLR